jgi:hypothetical protein
MHEITHCCEDINEVMLRDIFVRMHTLSIYPVDISGGLYPLRVGRRQYINLKIAVGE